MSAAAMSVNATATEVMPAIARVSVSSFMKRRISGRLG
jgi:hypothetical protein